MKLLLAPVFFSVSTCSISLTFVKSTMTLRSLTFDVVTVQTFPSLIIVAELEGLVLRLGSLKEADCYFFDFSRSDMLEYDRLLSVYRFR
jgi:hypothetical protein